MFSASMLSASLPADPSTLLRTAKHFRTRICTAYLLRLDRHLEPLHGLLQAFRP
jgi:hypothetical protein